MNQGYAEVAEDDRVVQSAHRDGAGQLVDYLHIALRSRAGPAFCGEALSLSLSGGLSVNYITHWKTIFYGDGAVSSRVAMRYWHVIRGKRSVMKKIPSLKIHISAIPVCLAIFALSGCATYNEVETEAVTSALDFEDEKRFAVEVPDTAPIDTAFSQRMQAHATEALIDELEAEGFEYVGEKRPDLRITFATYAVIDDGYIDTTRPIVRRVVGENVIQTTTVRTSRSAETVKTTMTMDPIYVSGPSRVFLLDVTDSDTDVLIWRAYVIEEGTDLDTDLLSTKIDRLVERLVEET